jgi:NTE family protein
MGKSSSRLSPERNRRRFVKASAAVCFAPAGLRSVRGAAAHVGLALGSGSVHGYAHIGVLKALEARGLRPNVVTGTSAGAIVGALWAFGLSSDRVHQAVKGLGWWRNRAVAFDRGLLRNSAVGEVVGRHTRGVPIESWPTKFAAVATDYATGQRVLLSRGPAAPVVQASSSVPVLYSPVRLHGRLLVDGGLSEPMPVRAARELGARVVLAVDVAYRPREQAIPGLTGAPLHTVHILIDRLIEEQVKEADLAIRLDVHRWVDGSGTHDALIAVGEKAVEERWADIEALLAR